MRRRLFGLAVSAVTLTSVIIVPVAASARTSSTVPIERHAFAAATAPAGCNLTAFLPKVRGNRIEAGALLKCSHRQATNFSGIMLQRREGSRWVIVKAEGAGPIPLRSNSPFFLTTYPVKCLAGQHTYRSLVEIAFPSGVVTKRSPGERLNC
jgi:hypothetical protein